METHTPDIYGSISLNTDEGLTNKKIYSQGPGVQAVWSSGTMNVSWANNTLSTTVDGVLDTEVLNLISSDVGNVATQGTDGRVLVQSSSISGKFSFTSPSSLTHVLVHNLNNSFPTVTVWNTATNQVLVPSQITSNSPNQLTITFVGLPRAIAGTIVG